MPVSKVSGQAGQVRIGTFAPSISSWDLTVENDLQETTGSDNYDPVTGTLWKSFAKGIRGASGSIEGRYDVEITTGTVATFLMALLDPDPVQIVFGVTRDIDFGYGLFHLENINPSLEVDGEVTFTCDVTLTDKFTPGTPTGV